jgi:hypothetical protein
VTLQADGLPAVVIRDQKPMKLIDEKIAPDSSLQQYLDAINSRVFFWPSRERLERLRGAKEYRSQRQLILHVTPGDSSSATGQPSSCAGSTPARSPRRTTRRVATAHGSIADYPYDEYRRRYGRGNELAEVTVLDAVPDIEDLLVDVEFVGRAAPCSRSKCGR